MGFGDDRDLHDVNQISNTKEDHLTGLLRMTDAKIFSNAAVSSAEGTLIDVFGNFVGCNRILEASQRQL